MIISDDIIVAYSTNATTRHMATSGGIGSCIVQELFKSGYIKSALSYKFDNKSLKYHPCIITKAEDYSPTGSIYHEIPLIDFIKKNINEIKSPFICFALPCQVTPIKTMLTKQGIEAFILELTCSSQQSHEATQYLIKRARINNRDIELIRYRGNGWPGGVTITLKDGNALFFDNNKSLWNMIFHSHLFIMRRCFFCSAVKHTPSDIQLADPWGIDQPNREKEGRTLCYIKSEKAARILNEIVDSGGIEYNKTEKKLFYASQMGTIVRKNFNLQHPQFTRITRTILQSNIYKKNIQRYPPLFTLHCILYKITFKVLHKIAKIINCRKLTNTGKEK